jgi:hypothetical protein
MKIYQIVLWMIFVFCSCQAFGQTEATKKNYRWTKVCLTYSDGGKKMILKTKNFKSAAGMDRTSKTITITVEYYENGKRKRYQKRTTLNSGCWGDNSTVQIKNGRTLHLYRWGLYAYGVERDSCVKELSKNYGFDEIEKAGCAITGWQERRWTRHNKRMKKTFRKRLGENWEETYDAELLKCME